MEEKGKNKHIPPVINELPEDWKEKPFYVYRCQSLKGEERNGKTYLTMVGVEEGKCRSKNFPIDLVYENLEEYLGFPARQNQIDDEEEYQYQIIKRVKEEQAIKGKIPIAKEDTIILTPKNRFPSLCDDTFLQEIPCLFLEDFLLEEKRNPTGKIKTEKQREETELELDQIDTYFLLFLIRQLYEKEEQEFLKQLVLYFYHLESSIDLEDEEIEMIYTEDTERRILSLFEKELQWNPNLIKEFNQLPISQKKVGIPKPKTSILTDPNHLLSFSFLIGYHDFEAWIESQENETRNLLLQHPKIQNRLREEWYEAVRERGREEELFANYTTEELFQIMNGSFWKKRERYLEPVLSYLFQHRPSDEILFSLLKDDTLSSFFLKELSKGNFLAERTEEEIVKLIEKDYFFYQRRGEGEEEPVEGAGLLWLGKLSKEMQQKIIQKPWTIDQIPILFSEFHPSVLTEFFTTDPRAVDCFSSFDMIDLMEKGVQFPQRIKNHPDFIPSIRNIDFVYLRHLTNEIEEIHPERFEREEQELEELKEKYIEYLEGQEKDAMDERIMDEIVVDTLLKDNLYNVWINIKEMLRYHEEWKGKEKLLSEEDVLFYQQIQKIDELPWEEKKDFWNQWKGSHLDQKFYEENQRLRNHSYNQIKKALFQIETGEEYKNEVLSERYGIDIYDLRKQEYTLLVRSLSRFEEENPHSFSRTGCYTLLSNENTTYYEESTYFGGCEEEYFLYGYSTFQNDYVITVYENDAYTSDEIKESTRRVNRIMTPRQIITNHAEYSEIQILHPKQKNGMNRIPKPDFLVCFNQIEKREVEESNRLQIPIVLATKNEMKKGTYEITNENLETNYYETDYSYLRRPPKEKKKQ